MSRPSLPRQPTGRGSSAIASQAKATGGGTVHATRFNVQLRRLNTDEIITLAGFIRLVAHGAEQPTELGRMPAGSRISWNAGTWEICDG